MSGHEVKEGFMPTVNALLRGDLGAWWGHAKPGDHMFLFGQQPK